jgi:predicted nucleic acid-binding protein
MSKIFIDSNIILYLMDEDEQKRSVAQQLLLSNPRISAQVLTEVGNVCKRRFKYTKEQILNLWRDLISDCILVPTYAVTFKTAIEISKTYNFQLFDSIIVASALNSGCDILYSEDMQHQMVVNQVLTIINPFR